MRRRGFTIMELIVVVGIIGVLASMLFPVFARARELARAAQCAASVAELGLALQMYATDWGGAYPPQEDNLAPIADRVQTESVFRCPSARYSGITLAQQKLLARATEKRVVPWMAGAPSREQDLRYRVVIADGVLLGSDYYYHAGLTTESPPEAVLLAEREAAHMGRAHVLYASGQVRRLPEAEWRQLVPPAAMRGPEDYGEESPPPQSGAKQGGG
jgi:prepilin-type N-terminal cleavage/methylation domain-containing protein